MVYGRRLKGFTEDGKFRPTDKTPKLNSSQILNEEKHSSKANSKNINKIMNEKKRKATVNQRWSKEVYDGEAGEDVIYTKKKDPKLTVEMHTAWDDSGDEHPDMFWYIFPARNGKGIPNSPEVLSKRSGGYKKADAIEELKKQLDETDKETIND